MVTLDYGIITHGIPTMILSDKKRLMLKAGDIFVRRGTIHGWHNEGTEWVRMYCIMLRKYQISRFYRRKIAEYPFSGPEG